MTQRAFDERRHRRPPQPAFTVSGIEMLLNPTAQFRLALLLTGSTDPLPGSAALLPGSAGILPASAYLADPAGTSP